MNPPINWKVVRLGEICEINPSKREVSHLDENEEISFLPMAAISDAGAILYEETRPLKEVLKGFTYFKKGDILVAKITPCFENGKHAWLEDLKHEIGFGSTEFHVIRAKEDVLPKFVKFLVNHPLFRKKGELKMTGSAGQKRVPRKFLEDYKLILPPLPTQRRIVAILEKAEKLKRLREENIKDTDELIKSVFVEMFGNPVMNPKGWPFKRLADLAILEREMIAPEDIKNGTAYIGLEHIESGTGRILAMSPVNMGDLKSGKYAFTEAHLLYGKLRPYLNKIALPERGGICSTDIIPILPNEAAATRTFLASLLRHPHYIEMATQKSSGANLPRISPKELAEFRLIAPPFNLQKQYEEIVQKIKSMNYSNSSACAEVDDLFNALMQKAFKGVLVA